MSLNTSHFSLVRTISLPPYVAEIWVTISAVRFPHSAEHSLQILLGLAVRVALISV